MNDKKKIEDVMAEVRELLRPFEAGPIEWVRMPMDKARSHYGIAVLAPLTAVGCTASVLTELIASISGKLLTVFEQESLAGLQITFGKENGGVIEKCYRIMIPAGRLKDAADLEILPETRHRNAPGMQGFWYSSQRRDE